MVQLMYFQSVSVASYHSLDPSSIMRRENCTGLVSWDGNMEDSALLMRQARFTAKSDTTVSYYNMNIE